MRTKRSAVLWIVVGFVAGIAAVVSCGNTALVIAQQDMGGSCAGSCTVSGPIAIQQPVNVQVQQPVAITASSPLQVSLSDPNPVPVSVSAPNPLPVSVPNPLPVSGSVTASGTVAVSSIASPVSIAGPVDVNVQAQALTVTQPVKTITADTDKNQLQGGSAGAGVTPFVKGPFVITDLTNSPGNSANVSIGAAATCPGNLMTINVQSPGIHGTRIFVPAGGVACDDGGNPIQWSGFVPY